MYAGYLLSVSPVFSLSLRLSTILKYTDDAVIVGNIAADADSENYLYLVEINRKSLLRKSSDLLLNPTETNEVLFTTQRNPPPHFEQLSLNGTVITPSIRLNYLSAAMDNKLRLETYILLKFRVLNNACI